MGRILLKARSAGLGMLSARMPPGEADTPHDDTTRSERLVQTEPVVFLAQHGDASRRAEGPQTEGDAPAQLPLPL